MPIAKSAPGKGLVTPTDGDKYLLPEESKVIDAVRFDVEL